MLRKLEQILRAKREKLKNAHGFTLIELIIVVVIIGILVAMATQDMGRTTEESKIARAKGDVKTLTGALDLYYADTGKTDATGTISADGGSPCDILTKTGTKIDGGAAGPWMKSCPVPPWVDTSYTVTVDTSGSATRYVVSITSPNGAVVSSTNLAKTTTSGT